MLAVFPKLTETKGVPLVLHALTLCLLALCLLCSAVSILISLYNSVSNPYETYMGPIGIYASSAISGERLNNFVELDSIIRHHEYEFYAVFFFFFMPPACLSVLALVVFVVNFSVTTVAEDLVRTFSENVPVDLKIVSSELLLGYYLLIPYAALSLIAIGLIYMYDHAAYTQRREQQRPTEDAPKEIMMY